MSGNNSVYSDQKRITSVEESQGIRRLPVRDRLIKVRESILDLFTGTNPEEVLNEEGDSGGILKSAGKEITGELKRFLDVAKIDAMDEQGLHVNYESLRISQLYQEYRQSCAPRMRYFDPGTLSSREEQLAFWINLYNALIMDGVIAKQITQTVGSSPLGLLTFFRQTAYNVGGHRMNCDDIEHGLLRANKGHPMLPGPQFASSDPRLTWVVYPVDVRVHFALNCAGRSCPPIQIYTPEDIDAQLDLAARNFVNVNIEVDPPAHKVRLSAIFSWFKGDFGDREGVIDFLINYLPGDERRAWLVENRDKLSFHYEPYDWGLNSFDLG
jgi:hypothetical protein